MVWQTAESLEAHYKYISFCISQCRIFVVLKHCEVTACTLFPVSTHVQGKEICFLYLENFKIFGKFFSNTISQFFLQFFLKFFAIIFHNNYYFFHNFFFAIFHNLAILNFFAKKFNTFLFTFYVCNPFQVSTLQNLRKGTCRFTERTADLQQNEMSS